MGARGKDARGKDGAGCDPTRPGMGGKRRATRPTRARPSRAHPRPSGSQRPAGTHQGDPTPWAVDRMPPSHTPSHRIWVGPRKAQLGPPVNRSSPPPPHGVGHPSHISPRQIGRGAPERAPQTLTRSPSPRTSPPQGPLKADSTPPAGHNHLTHARGNVQPPPFPRPPSGTVSDRPPLRANGPALVLVGKHPADGAPPDFFVPRCVTACTLVARVGHTIVVGAALGRPRQ